jgi:hypothetical protein
MVRWGKIIPIFIGAASLCAAVRADMVSLSPADTGCVSSQSIRLTGDSPSASSSSPCVGFPAIADFSLLPGGSLPQPDVETGQAGETKSPQILVDKQNSVSLCLYALLGLGLCRSAPWVKRLHVGGIPDWYHSSGPYQIGHSFALAPDCLCPRLVCCLVQPGAVTRDLLSQRYRETLASLPRKSQSTLSALASRGPP